jgi:uncharacterized protein (TIGR02145 family)
MFYQWNRKIGWSSTDPMTNSNGGTEWDSTIPEGTEWETANDPSPAGWRVPTFDELKSLFDAEKVTNEWTTQNGVTGRRFIDITTGKSLFFPAAGYRYFSVGTLSNAGTSGSYWSSTQDDSGYAYGLYFSSGGAGAGTNDYYRSYGFCVRPVAE